MNRVTTGLSHLNNDADTLLPKGSLRFTIVRYLYGTMHVVVVVRLGVITIIHISAVLSNRRPRYLCHILC